MYIAKTPVPIVMINSGLKPKLRANIGWLQLRIQIITNISILCFNGLVAIATYEKSKIPMS